MAEGFCSMQKDVLVVKTSKGSSFLSRMIILVVAMALGIYICSVCIKQISDQTRTFVQIIGNPCDSYQFSLCDSSFLHYPQPQTFRRAECADNPVQYFAIISVQRSGSGWFETLLNSHVNVSSNGEIFSVKDRRSNISSIVGTLDRVYSLDWISSASKNECSAAVGFKWMLNQGLMQHPEELSEYFNAKGVSLIFLFRRNLLRRMVSLLANSYDSQAKLLNGKHKSHVHTHEEAEKLSTYKPFINQTTLISQLRQMESVSAKALESFNNTRHLVLYYEDLVRNHTKLVDVQDFLGLPRMKLTSRHVKIHKGSLHNHITNWEEVNRTLQGTAYESFLHDDY
ncbi:hypothetical protein Drorol1_Dr00009115 [Drosera rotundifolia]